jgi:anoctamin-10
MISKERELGYADLLSLEPVDSQARPMRLREKKFKELNEERIIKSRTEGDIEGTIQDDNGGRLKTSSSHIPTLQNFLKSVESNTNEPLYSQLVDQNKSNGRMMN